MSKGCPCKSASDLSSNCAYCPPGKVPYVQNENVSQDQTYGDSGSYQNYNQYNNPPYNNNYNQYNNNYPYNNQYPYNNNQNNYPYNNQNNNYPYNQNNNYPYDNQYNYSPYGPASEYSYGSQKGGQFAEEPQGFELSDGAVSLLKAVAVFCTGCFLTMKMTGVANELG